MPHLYDTLDPAQLRRKACIKWRKHPDDVLPLWVADMDFPIAEAIKRAMANYLEGENFGYPEWEGLPGLREALTERLAERYKWRVQTQEVLLINGIVPGLFLGLLALSEPGDEVIVPTPIYPPFMLAIENTGRVARYSPLKETAEGYKLEFDQLASLISPKSKLLMLCNPHNPVGRVYTRAELEKLADFAREHGLWVVSDELHADLTYPELRHTPFASVSEDAAARCLTLYGPTKPFNIAGLGTGFAIGQDPDLMKRIKTTSRGLIGLPNVMGQTATIAAYREGDAWLNETLAYLDGNRRFIETFLNRDMPEVGYRPPEGGYLAWLDFRRTGLAGQPAELILERSRVALNAGPDYGQGGEGFARLNFATSRAILGEALERIRRSVKEA